ncbi:hypothetical protein [Celeribacter sp.]|uniref:hypothetical protein n=1 Tax=Celeribacter sp. TaxID=1890673 RepID=UPI003A922426
MASRTLRRALSALVALVGGFAIGLFILGYSPLLAAACPSCFGFERAAGERAVHIEPNAGVDPALMIARYEEALVRVERFFGPLAHHPVVLVCVTPTCNRVMGDHGHRAMTYGHHVFYLGPHGHETAIVAHELAHVALHQRIGLRATKRLPAWVDEGLATMVSEDPRYDLDPETCTPPHEALPMTSPQWRREAAEAKVSLYGLAGCAVARWFDAHPDATVDDLVAAFMPSE